MKKLFSMLLVLSVLVSCIGTAFVTEAAAATVGTGTATDDMIIADWLFAETVYYRDAESIMSEYADAGITDVFLLVKGLGGRLAWQSKVSGTVMSYGERDILQETCDAAKKYGVRVHAWMAAGQDNTYLASNPSALAYHYRVGTDYDTYGLNKFVDYLNTDYQAYMRALIKELNTYDIAGIHFDYIRYGTLFYNWGASTRNELINNYGITKAEYNAAVKAMCVTANEEYGGSYGYTTNSDGYYVYTSGSVTGVTFAEAMVGQGTTDAKNGTLKVAQMRKDLIKNFIAEVTSDLSDDKQVSCAIMPESVTDYGAQAYYCQDPAVLKDVVDFVAIMTYASQYGGANTWPASVAKQCVADGCNAIAAIQTFDCENSNADPTCTDIYNEFYNVVSTRATVNADSSYSAKILGCAFFRAAKMTLASAYVKDSSTMNFTVHQQDESQSGVTKLIFTMKNGVKIDSVSNKVGWGSSTFTISSDKTTLTITNSSGILSSYGSASFDMAYTGTVSETTGACMLTSYKSSGEYYGFCSTLFPRHTHTYSSKITTASTCVTEGVKTYSCSCGDTYTEAMPLIDHIYTGTVTTDPTCSAVGIRLYKCSGCTSSYTEEIPKVAHVYSSEYDEATGKTTFTCDNCGTSFQSSCGFTHERIETWAVEGNTHFAFCYGCNVYLTYSCHFVESSRTAATCTTDGSVTYICGGHTDANTGQIVKDVYSGNGCTNTYTETLPASCTFTYSSNIDGTHNRVCVACGKKEATTDCVFVDGICTDCGYSAKDYTLLHFKSGSAETTWNWEFFNGSSAVTYGSTSNGSMTGTSVDTAGNPYFLIWPQDHSGINHTVKEGDVVEVRLRMNVTSNPGGNTTCTPDVRLQTGTSAYSSLTGNAKQLVRLSLTTNEWQTVQIPIVGNVYSEGYVINRILFDPWNTLMYIGADIEIDYIYIGQPNTAPSASPNSLFFDFTNSDRSSARYNGNTYEGYKFDIIPWGYNTALSTAPTFDYSAEGTLTIGNIKSDKAYAQTTPNYASLPNTPLEYTTASGDIVEMRFKTEGLTAASGATPSVSLYYDLNNAGSINKKFSFTCSSADILSGEYVTVRTTATAGQLISALRPYIEGISSSGDGKFILDYIFVGKASDAPSANADILFFDFNDDEAARVRYDSYAYGYYNYDIDGWGVNTSRNTAPTLENGTMSTTVLGESPYLQINAGASKLSARPLNFNPAKVDMVQVRFKLENLERSSDYNAPAFVFKFMLDDATQVTTSSYLSSKLSADQLTSGEYITLSMPVGDYFEGASVITTMQVCVANVKPIEGKTASVTIDYIYVGPMKENISFVYFYNASGTQCMEVSFSDNGSIPVYNGEIPQMEPTAAYHCEFGGWVDADGNEVNLETASFKQDTNLYASYANVTHEYTYSGDENGHSGICSCGVPTKTSAHIWNEGVITTEATCTTDGVITYSCKTCNYERDESYAAGGHTYATTVTAPTCTTDGYTTHTCTCGDTYADAYITAFGHSYSTVVNAATCTQNGYSAHTCATCGDYYVSDETAAFGHSYEIAKTEPTCTTDGCTVHTCSTCGDSYSEVIAAIGHTVTYKEKCNATCTEAGYTAHYNCSTCGNNYIDADCTYSIPDSYLYTEALGHSVTFYNDKDATCTENGYYAHYKCANCSTYFVDAECQFSLPENYVIIGALGHNYTSTVVAPTCTEGGYTIHTCSKCSDNYKSNELPATGHNYINGTCICGATEITEPTYKFNENLAITMSISVGAEMQVIYNIPNSRVKNFDSFYLEVVKDVVGGESVTTVFSLENENLVAATNASGAISRYSATYTGIFAMEMGDNFTATLYAVAADGTINYGTSVSGSIKSFLMNKLAAADSADALKTLAVDMLNYGAAAQLNFNYNVENLVNADLTDAQKALGTNAAPVAVDNSSSTTTGGRIITSVSLQSKVLLYVSCVYKSTVDSSLLFVVKNADGKILDTYAPTEINTNNCKFVYDNVSASQMRDLITIELYDKGVLVSRTLTWSIESYVAQTRNDSNSSETLINAVNAMLTYGDSAYRYFNATNQQ